MAGHLQTIPDAISMMYELGGIRLLNNWYFCHTVKKCISVFQFAKSHVGSRFVLHPRTGDGFEACEVSLDQDVRCYRQLKSAETTKTSYSCQLKTY